MKPGPIACSLTDQAARAQLDEWRQVMNQARVEAVRVSPNTLSLRLADHSGQLAALVDLARREKACCAFFDFAILIGATDIEMRVSVPDDATAILDEFAGLAGIGR